MMKKSMFLASMILAGIALPTCVWAQNIDSPDGVYVMSNSRIEYQRQLLEKTYSQLANDLKLKGLERRQRSGLPLSSQKYGQEYKDNPLPYDMVLDEVEWNGHEFIVKLTGAFDELLRKDNPSRYMDGEDIAETLSGWRETLGLSADVHFLVRTNDSSEYFSPLMPLSDEDREALERDLMAYEKVRAQTSEFGRNQMRSKNLPLGGILAGKKIAVSPGHGWVQNIHWKSGLSGTSFGLQRETRCNFDPNGEAEGIVEDHSNNRFASQWLIPMLENMGAEVITVREMDLIYDADTVIDNSSSEFSKSGEWGETTDRNGENGNFRYFYGSNALYSKDSKAKATWTHTFSTTGYKLIQAWYGEASDRSTKVKYTITDAAGDHVVYVNQRAYGRFRNLGRYWAAGGVPIKVTVENVANDGFMIADAIKMRAGRESITGGKHPWWEMDAYYYIHRYVLDAQNGEQIWQYTTSLRSMYAERAGADLLVSVHSNAAENGNCATRVSGTAQGLWLYAKASPSSKDKLFGNLLKKSILDSVWDRVDPNFCSMGNLHNENLGEISTSNIPAMLVEMAYHDNLTPRSSCNVNDDSINAGKSPRNSDNEYLQMPAFREAMARGITDAIAQYFVIQAKGGSVSDYQKYTYSLPDRPKGVRAINNTADSSITVSWDAVDRAEGYMVYKINNLRPKYQGAWDAGTFVKEGTSYTFKDLEPGRVYAFKVSAVSKIGESFTSPSVVARINGVGHKNKGLYINGFTRWDAKVNHEVNTFEYAQQHGIALGAVADDFYFDGAMSDAVEKGSVSLKDYKIIDLETGRNNGTNDTVTAKMQEVLTTYMNGGGNLLISGGEIGWALVAKNGGKSFFSNILKASYTEDQDDVKVYAASGTGDFAALGDIAIDDGSHGTYKALYSDAFTPTGGSSAVINYKGSSVSGAAAVASDHVVMVGFPIETIYDDQKRAEVVGCAIKKMVYGKACTPADHQVLADGAKATTANGKEEPKECEGSEKACKDEAVLKTCKNGKWTEKACGEGKKCENKKCVDIPEEPVDPVDPPVDPVDPIDPPVVNECEGDASICVDEATLKSCSDGKWIEEACGDGWKCENNECRAAQSDDVDPAECTDGEKLCIDKVTRRICEGGSWVRNKCKTGYFCNEDAVCEREKSDTADVGDEQNESEVHISSESCSANGLNRGSNPAGALWMLFGLFGVTAFRRRRRQ